MQRKDCKGSFLLDSRNLRMGGGQLYACEVLFFKMGYKIVNACRYRFFSDLSTLVRRNAITDHMNRCFLEENER